MRFDDFNCITYPNYLRHKKFKSDRIEDLTEFIGGFSNIDEPYKPVEEYLFSDTYHAVLDKSNIDN